MPSLVEKGFQNVPVLALKSSWLELVGPFLSSLPAQVLVDTSAGSDCIHQPHSEADQCQCLVGGSHDTLSEGQWEVGVYDSRALLAEIGLVLLASFPGSRHKVTGELGTF